MKLGSISFVNSLPVDLGLFSGQIASSAALIPDTPARLNERLLRGELDASPVSALFFAEHADDFYLLPDLSISSGSAVDSVLLLSRKPIEDLNGALIAVTVKGRTTPALLQVLLQERLGFKARLEKKEMQRAWPKGFDAILVIGDEALAWKERAATEKLFIWDLAEAWRQWTGLPFVFAVWAVRRDVFKRDPQAARRLHRALLDSKEWGLSHMEDVRRAAATESGLSAETIAGYFRRLFYGLGDEQKQGLAAFLQKAGQPAAFEELPAEKTVRAGASVDDILRKALDGGRVSIAEGVKLFEEAGLFELGHTANELNISKNPQAKHRATFLVDRNINYTNICYTYCKFCAFYREPGDVKEGYLRSTEEIFKKIEELVAIGGTQVLMQGGHNPQLGIEYYEQLVRDVRARFPQVHVHSFSASEVQHISRVSKLSIRETLTRLKAAGLNSLPGGGAEILVDRVRNEVSPLKTKVSEYFEIHRAAHEVGLISTGTMVYGLGETLEERMMHLDAYRHLQDQTKGFRAFIPWSFESESTEMKLPRRSGHEYLRMIALSRIMLDNIQHLQAGWVTEGPKLSQIALGYGADDFGGILMEENVVSATKSDKLYSNVTKEEAIRLIRETGKTPVQRNTNYEVVQVHSLEADLASV
jgi:dehypoxanthine futalosine cyclase